MREFPNRGLSHRYARFSDMLIVECLRAVFGHPFGERESQMPTLYWPSGIACPSCGTGSGRGGGLFPASRWLFVASGKSRLTRLRSGYEAF